MRDQAVWSVSLGRWSGVQIRLHMFFLLFAAFTFYLSWLYTQTEPASGPAENSLGVMASSLLCLAILGLSVLIHELSHLLVANRLGASVDEIVLGPLGGLGSLPSALEPQSDLMVIMAGPLSNLLICFLTALCLAIHGGANLVGLMYPLAPDAVAAGDPLVIALKMAFWVNWLLVLVNLIPAYPFDGGRALRAAVLVIRPRLEPQRAVMIVAAVAKVIAVGLLVVAWLVHGDNTTYIVQTWFALVLLSIFVFFSGARPKATRQILRPTKHFSDMTSRKATPRWNAVVPRHRPRRRPVYYCDGGSTDESCASNVNAKSMRMKMVVSMRFCCKCTRRASKVFRRKTGPCCAAPAHAIATGPRKSPLGVQIQLRVARTWSVRGDVSSKQHG